MNYAEFEMERVLLNLRYPKQTWVLLNYTDIETREDVKKQQQSHGFY